MIVDELVRSGIREAVVSPGSRSAPLAIALLSHPGIRLHVRIDERSGSFLALGLAKATGTPAVVVCTSGTAAANFHPAILEADLTETPLIVITADRPPELRGTGCNQTVDQVKMYGSGVRFFAEISSPEGAAAVASYWRSVTSRAVLAAAEGPVHLNVALRDPLLADPGAGDFGEADRSQERAWTRAAGRNRADAVEIDTPERGVVIVGAEACDVPGALRLAESQGWPLMAEPTSNARHGSNALSSYSLLLKSGRLSRELAPDMVVTWGRPTVSKDLLALTRQGKEHIVVSRSRAWPDPTRTASQVVPAVMSSRTGSATDWLRKWKEVDSTARRVVDEVIEDNPMSDIHLARSLFDFIPEKSALFVGSSMPVRNVDLAMTQRPDIKLMANRGASGIDGAVSTAIGAALGSGDGTLSPGFAFLGDLSFLHDQNGLLIGAKEPRPQSMTIVVANNDGGGIFSLLPYAGLPADDFDRIFGTAHGARLSQVAAAAGWDYIALTSAAEMSEVLSPVVRGLRVVELRTDRSVGADLHRKLVHRAVEEVEAKMDRWE